MVPPTFEKKYWRLSAASQRGQPVVISCWQHYAAVLMQHSGFQAPAHFKSYVLFFFFTPKKQVLLIPRLRPHTESFHFNWLLQGKFVL